MSQCVAASMAKDRDEESGQYTETVSDDEILAYLDEEDGAGTTDVADAFDYQQPTAYRRLKRLEEDGLVTSRKVGGSLFWMSNND